MSFFGPEIDFLLRQPDWDKRIRDLILDLHFDDGTFSKSELIEIKIALALISKSELSNIEKNLQDGGNRLLVAVELIAGVRLKYGDIFPN